ncbi:sugar ABC transporter substrate-binding protein [Microbacterium sp. ZW CA_36]|uniref:sugar ABC transporter substrate-binding protein n=1 Tax=Microbacterium sp. ZW CA_36 TaxID=3378078 RepID=UPI0038521E2E
MNITRTTRTGGALTLAVMTALVVAGCTNAPGSAEASAAADNGGYADKLAPIPCEASPTTDELLNAEAPRADERYEITVLLASLSGYYYQAMAYGATQAAEQSGVEVTIQAGSGYTTPEAQLTQAQTAIQQGADAIVIQPVDPRGSLPVLKAAQEADIPVIVTSTELASSEQAGTVVQDDYAIGVAGADQLAKLHPDGGKGVLIAGPATATWSVKRAAGFTDRIKEEYPDFEIVASPTQPVDPSVGLSDFTAAAQANPGVEWVYSVFFYQLLPGSLPAQYAGIPFVTTGYEPAAITALQDGSLKETMQLDNVWMGSEPVYQAISVLNGDSIPRITCMPQDVYSVADIGSPSADGELYPEEFVAK